MVFSITVFGDLRRRRNKCCLKKHKLRVKSGIQKFSNFVSRNHCAAEDREERHITEGRREKDS